MRLDGWKLSLCDDHGLFLYENAKYCTSIAVRTPYAQKCGNNIVQYRMPESEENARVEEAMTAGENAGPSAKLQQGRPCFVEQRRIYVSKQFRTT